MTKRGLTLPELLVACGLASLVLAGLTVLFVQAIRYHRSLQTSLELQENNLSAIAILSRDISETSLASVGAEPTGVVLASPRGLDDLLQVDAQGRLLWRKWVCFYVEDVNGVPCLVRKEEALASPQDTAPVVPAGMNVLYFQGSAAPYSVLARDVEALDFEVVDQVVKLHLVSSLVKAGETYRIESRSDVAPKS